MNRRGFTLIELLVVISIIGILTTLVAVTVRPIQMKSRDSRRKADIALTRSGLDLFKTDFKVYPNFTFVLGTSSVAGEENSSFGLNTELQSCLGLTNASPDGPNGFASYDPLDPTNLDKATLKEGFEAVNRFLICNKYMEQVVKDPTQLNADGYQYLVSSDYADMIIAAKLENANDQTGRELLFEGVLLGSPDSATKDSVRRFIEGNGRNIRQLAVDSNINVLPFFTSLVAAPTALTDGVYLYQCLKKASDQTTVNRDDRSGSTYLPLIQSGSSYSANSACHNAAASLHQVQSWGSVTNQ